MDFYLSLNGRVSLGQYWLRWILPVFAIGIVLGVVLGATGMINMDNYDPMNPYASLPLPIIIFGIAMIWPSVAVGVKRLHDIGWTGWLYLLSFVPIAGLVIAVVTLFIPGNQGENKYGPDPRNK
jgi:uncharacterized membrane protein YhaH (DUF805 family)